MQPAFDPYREWLGVSDERRPPHHYRLLGLPLFEDRPAAVAAAAARWSTLLRAMARTEHGGEALRVLQEVEAARACLLDREAKRDYDAALQAELTARPRDYESRKAKKNLDGDRRPPQALPATTSVWKPSDETAPPPLPPAAVPSPAVYPAALPPSAFPPALSPASFMTPPPVAQPLHPMAAPVAMPVPQFAGNGNDALPMAVPVSMYGVPQAAVMPPAIPTALPVAPYPAGGYALPVAVVAPAAVPQATPVETPVCPASAPSAPFAEGSRAPSASTAAQARGRARSKQTSALVFYAGAPAVAVVVIGLLVMVFKNQPATDKAAGAVKTSSMAAVSKDAPPPHVAAKPSAGALPLNSPVADAPRPADRPVNPVPIPDGPVEKPAPLSPVVAPAPAKPAMSKENEARQLAAAQQSLDAARTAMSRRDLKGARALLKKAESADAGGKLSAETSRLDLMAQALENFWNGVREGIKSLEAGTQVTIRETVAGVVENSPDKLILRVNGENKTYLLDDLPPGLALGLAENWLTKGTPETKLALGAFQAMDSRADRKKAQPLFDEAAALGKPREAAMLIAELSVPVPTAGDAATADSIKPGADGRYPPPTSAAAAKARDEVRAMFEVDFSEAREPAARLALAEKLAARAEASDSGFALRYMLLVDSQQLAAQAGDFERAIAIVDKLAEGFSIDALDAKADMLLEAAKSADAPEANRALANAALALSDEAVLLEKPMQALRAVRIALGVARKSRDADLLKQASAREKEIKELKKP